MMKKLILIFTASFLVPFSSSVAQSNSKQGTIKVVRSKDCDYKFEIDNFLIGQVQKITAWAVLFDKKSGVTSDKFDSVIPFKTMDTITINERLLREKYKSICEIDGQILKKVSIRKNPSAAEGVRITFNYEKK